MIQPEFTMANDQNQLIYEQVSPLTQEICENFNIIFGILCNLLLVLYVLTASSSIQFHDVPISIEYTNEKEDHEHVYIHTGR